MTSCETSHDSQLHRGKMLHVAIMDLRLESGPLPSIFSMIYLPSIFSMIFTIDMYIYSL